MNNISKTKLINAVFSFSCIYLIFTLLFSINMQRPALWLFFATYVVDYFYNNRIKQWKWSNEKIIFVVWIAYFLLIPLYHIFETNHCVIYSHVFNYNMPFLGIGIMGLMYTSQPFKLRYIAWAFVFVSISTIAYIFYYVNFDCVDGMASLSSLFAIQRIEHIGPHMYYNMFLNASLIMAFYLLSCKYSHLWNKVLAGSGAVIIFVTLLLSDGRTGFITSILVTMIYLLSFVWKRWHKWIIPTFAFFLVLGCIVVVNHPRININKTSQEPRAYVWKVAKDVIKERPIFGFGVSNGRIRFVEIGENNVDFMKSYGYEFAESSNKYVMHPHNVLLEGWIEFGILGLLLVSAILFLPFFIKETKNRFYLVLFAIVVLIQAMFETFGSDFVPLFITVVTLWLIVGKEESEEPLLL